MAIRKIKLPGEQEPREIGALSSNIVYDAVTPTVSLNQKISSMEQIIEGLNSFEIAIVNTLPEEDIDDHTIYFVPQSQGSTTHDEYMYINNTWELIGSTTIDLSDYPTYDDISVTQGLTTGIPAATITVGATTTTVYSEDGSKWNNVTLSKTSANIAVNTYIPQLTSQTGTSANLAIASSTPAKYNIAKYDDSAMLHSVTPTAGDKSNKVATTSFVADAITTTVTPVAALTTGITIGSIDINGTTTTLYAPEDTKVRQNDVTNSASAITTYLPILLSVADKGSTTIIDEVNKTHLSYKPSSSSILLPISSTANKGELAIVAEDTNRFQVLLQAKKLGTNSTIGQALLQLGNIYPTGIGNSKGALALFGDGNKGNAVLPLDNSYDSGVTATQYINYLPMVDEVVLAAGVTTGVGSSTVPVYMAAGGELLACTLPTSASYSLSMTGATITLLADGVAASTITLPIYDGTVTLTDAGVVG